MYIIPSFAPIVPSCPSTVYSSLGWARRTRASQSLSHNSSQNTSHNERDVDRRRKRGITDIAKNLKKPKQTIETAKATDTTKDKRDLLKTSKFSDDLSILFGNVNGIKNKWNDIIAVSQSDHILCFNELNLSESDTALLSTKICPGVPCRIKALDRLSYDKKGNRKNLKNRKKKGFGTAIISKLSDSSKIGVCENDHEIVFNHLNLNGTKGLVIAGYRSPSSRVESDISAYYQSLESIISQHTSDHTYDFIIFVGDDNASLSSSSHYSRLAARKMLHVTEKYNMIDMLENIKTRGDRQPDSCFAYFNPENVEIDVSVLKGVTKSDHEMIQIKVHKSQIIAERPKYKFMTKRIQKVSDEEMADQMQSAFLNWYEKWNAKLSTITEKQLEKASNQFNEILNGVQAKCFTKKLKRVPVLSKKLDTDLDLSILQLRSKIAKTAFQLKNRESTALLRKLNLLNTQLKKEVNKASKALFQEDMHKQSKLERKNDHKFWDISGALLNKSSYQTAVEREITNEQIKVKLDNLDKTFINSDQDYIPDPLAYQKASAPFKKYKLLTDVKSVKETIDSMPRIQKFIKKNAENLKGPISLLLKMIQKTDHFPRIFKTSKCSIIGQSPKERAIFALSPIPKILETVIKLSFDKLKVEDGTFQMAYTKDRGTASCNLITLQEVEMSKEPTIQTLQDLVKAFNSTKHETIIEQAETKFGAGKLISSWLTNRSYTYDFGNFREIRGQKANQGVPAGTLIGVECFLLFIATATSLTSKNISLLWAALYADYTSPLVKSSKLVDLQKVLDFAIIWARKNNVRFHLDGSKAPTFLAYLKNDQIFPEEANSLNLDGVPLKRGFSEKILGLYRKIMQPIQKKGLSKNGFQSRLAAQWPCRQRES